MHTACISSTPLLLYSVCYRAFIFKIMTLKELAVDHDYYSSDSNYYSNDSIWQPLSGRFLNAL